MSRDVIVQFYRAYRPRLRCRGCGMITVFRCEEAGLEVGPNGKERGYARVIKCAECGHKERVN